MKLEYISHTITRKEGYCAKSTIHTVYQVDTVEKLAVIVLEVIGTSKDAVLHLTIEDKEYIIAILQPDMTIEIPGDTALISANFETTDITISCNAFSPHLVMLIRLTSLVISGWAIV
jgi:hypothetical protein